MSAVDCLPLIDNEDSFWDGLEELPEHQRGNRANLGLTKTQREAIKLRQLELKQQEAAQALAQFQQRLRDAQDGAHQQQRPQQRPQQR